MGSNGNCMALASLQYARELFAQGNQAKHIEIVDQHISELRSKTGTGG
jgi:hypothetical protein